MTDETQETPKKRSGAKWSILNGSGAIISTGHKDMAEAAKLCAKLAKENPGVTYQPVKYGKKYTWQEVTEGRVVAE